MAFGGQKENRKRRKQECQSRKIKCSVLRSIPPGALIPFSLLNLEVFNGRATPFPESCILNVMDLDMVFTYLSIFL